jgi:hypothetical protein
MFNFFKTNGDKLNIYVIPKKTYKAIVMQNREQGGSKATRQGALARSKQYQEVWDSM